IGTVSTPLKEYINQLSDKHISILIPGGGNSYEALYLLEQGFTDITVIDLAPSVTEKLRLQTDTYKSNIKIITGDFFELTGSYDLILEQTFFCAIDPTLRGNYVTKMSEILKPHGKLVGVLFNRSFESGPPFGGSEKEYRTLFASTFQHIRMEPCYNSIPPRSGSELFVIMSK
ncbi:MAG: methyltransferase domain-containing protein, partial [Chitinophagaceae bacterium]|nr:methyltransferase domain-containing protein [Chitinophagaceae bacterium]